MKGRDIQGGARRPRGVLGAVCVVASALVACSGGESGSGAPPGASTSGAPSTTSRPATSAVSAGTQAATSSSAAAAASASAVAPSATAGSGPAPEAGCPAGMVKIEGAKFKMGTPDIAREKPVHEVTVATFCMDRTEVTTAAYEECVKADGCKPTTHKSPFCNGGKSEMKDHPINCTSWKAATAYCGWAGKRLPTEEEWEFAARGVERRQYPWGDRELALALCWNAGNRGERGFKSTCTVGAYPEGNTPTGLSDMSGNVMEWTDTWDCPYDKHQACNKSWRSIRGGDWMHNTWTGMRGGSRGSLGPSEDDYRIGFRCAKNSP